MTEIPCILPGEQIALVSELKAHPSKKFRVRTEQGQAEAFVIRHRGRYYAYRNQCRHAGTPLDWAPNEFLDESGRLLLCHTHGALYEPTTGACAGGPCAGKALERIAIERVENEIRLKLT